MHAVQSAQIKYIVVQESVWKCYNDYFLKYFLLKIYIKIIFFLFLTLAH